MSTATVQLHETLIRLAKGMVTAWEEWVKTQKQNAGHSTA